MARGAAAIFSISDSDVLEMVDGTLQHVVAAVASVVAIARQGIAIRRGLEPRHQYKRVIGFSTPPKDGRDTHHHIASKRPTRAAAHGHLRPRRSRPAYLSF